MQKELKAVLLCTRQLLRDTRIWRNVCWPTGPIPMRRTRTARHLCSARHLRGHKEIAESLLASGADINGTKNRSGWTPLLLAASNGHVVVAEVLVANNVHVDFKDDEGRTALHFAAAAGHRNVAELLVASGADPNAKSNNGYTPLGKAAFKGNRDVAEFLLASGADPNAPDNDGAGPLHWAANKGHKSVVKLLLASGADPNAKSNDGRKPLDWASPWVKRDLAELFRLHEFQRAPGADPREAVSTTKPKKTQGTCHRCGRLVVSYVESGAHVFIIGIPADIDQSGFWCPTCEGVLCSGCAGARLVKNDFFVREWTTASCPVCGKEIDLASDIQMAAKVSSRLALQPPDETSTNPWWKRAGKTEDGVPSQYGIVSNGAQFAFQGHYVDDVQLTTVAECAAQLGQLSTVSEVCIMITDPVFVVVKFPRPGPVAFRTSLPGSSAEELVNALRPVEVKIYCAGKVCLARLR